MSVVRSRNLIFWLGVTLFLGMGIGWRYPWPADEPRFVLSAAEMIQSGDWLFPHRAGELYSDKPPLFIWLQALALLVTRSIRLGFLLPSIAASLATTWLLFDLTRRIAGKTAAYYAVGLLLATLQFAIQARSAQIDATVAALVALGLYGLVRHLLLGPRPGWYAVAWLAMGAGVITKGVGFLPIFALPGYWLWRRRRHASASALSTATRLVPLLFFVPIVCWLLPMVLAVGDDPARIAYRDDILMRQTAERYVDGLGHLEPITYYVTEVIPPLWFPLSALLLWLVPVWWRELKAGSGIHWMLSSFSLLGLLFFSLSPGKRGVYMLPLLPPLVVLAGPQLESLLRRTSVRRVAWATVLIGGLLALTLAVGISSGFEPLRTPLERAGAEGGDVARLLFAISVAWLTVALIAGPRRGVAAYVGVVLVTTLLACTWGYRLQEPWRSGHTLMVEVDRRLSPGSELAIVQFREQFILHAGREIVHWGFHRKPAEQVHLAAAWVERAPDRWILAPRSVAEECFTITAGSVVARRHRRDWTLLASADRLADRCSAQDAPTARPFVAPAIRIR